MKNFSGIEFASEHNGTDVFRLIELAYEQGRKDVIKQLPSAQPEIIRCKDCKHWMPYEWMFSEVWQSQNIDDYPEDEISCNYCDVHMKSSDFCSQAVRREVQDENDKTTNNTTNA